MSIITSSQYFTTPVLTISLYVSRHEAFLFFLYTVFVCFKLNIEHSINIEWQKIFREASTKAAKNCVDE